MSPLTNSTPRAGAVASFPGDLVPVALLDTGCHPNGYACHTVTLKTHNCYRVKQIAKWWAYNNCTLQPAGSSKQEWVKCPACRQPFGQHPQLLLPAVAVAAAAAAAAVAAGQCHATAVPPAGIRYSPESAGGTECRQALCTAGSTNVLH